MCTLKTTNIKIHLKFKWRKCRILASLYFPNMEMGGSDAWFPSRLGQNIDTFCWGVASKHTSTDLEVVWRNLRVLSRSSRKFFKTGTNLHFKNKEEKKTPNNLFITRSKKTHKKNTHKRKIDLGVVIYWSPPQEQNSSLCLREETRERN